MYIIFLQFHTLFCSVMVVTFDFSANGPRFDAGLDKFFVFNFYAISEKDVLINM